MKKYIVYHTNDCCSDVNLSGAFGIDALSIEDALEKSKTNIPAHWTNYKIVGIIDVRVKLQNNS